MKRLLDEDDPNDEIVRLLIRAAANHSPPRSSKMRMIAALGLGSAVGLSASEVLAWLGTSSGKVALAVTVIGAAAGGAYLATSTGAPASAPALSAAAASASAPSAPSAAEGLVSRAGEPAASFTGRDVDRGAASSQPPTERTAEEESLALGSAEMSPTTPRRAAAPPLERAQPVRAALARDGTEAPASARGAALASDAFADERERGHTRLADETTWVDRLRIAAESHDRRAFERLRSEYFQRFPEGQLHPEVARLSALLR